MGGPGLEPRADRGANVTVAVIDSGVAFEDYNTSLSGYPQTFKRATDLAGTTFVASATVPLNGKTRKLANQQTAT